MGHTHNRKGLICMKRRSNSWYEMAMPTLASAQIED